jgi:glyoxylase-like metal-dependent hydrolase (beta-lactamase superfamily II)
MRLPRPRWVLAPNPSLMTLDGTRTYIVGRERPVLIDPGPDIVAHIDNVLIALGGARPLAILITHSHSDHSGAADRLARATGSPLWMAPQAIHPPTARPTHSVRDGDTLVSDAGDLRILFTPGHSPDHISIHWTDPASDRGAAFVGDLLMGKGDTTLVAYPGGSVGEYLSSLDLIESLDCAVLYPAHGPPLLAPDAIRRHREHRLHRVSQLRRLLADHPGADPERLVDLVYGSALDVRLRSAASASVDAIVRYLATMIDLGEVSP